MMIDTLGDTACNEFDALTGTMDEARAVGQITDDDWLLIVAYEQMRAMRPLMEEIALTMRSQNQMSRTGVTGFPRKPLGRAIVELQQYKDEIRREQEQAAGLLRFKAKQSRSTAGTDNGAA